MGNFGKAIYIVKIFLQKKKYQSSSHFFFSKLCCRASRAIAKQINSTGVNPQNFIFKIDKTVPPPRLHGSKIRPKIKSSNHRKYARLNIYHFI